MYTKSANELFVKWGLLGLSESVARPAPKERKGRRVNTQRQLHIVVDALATTTYGVGREFTSFPGTVNRTLGFDTTRDKATSCGRSAAGTCVHHDPGHSSQAFVAHGVLANSMRVSRDRLTVENFPKTFLNPSAVLQNQLHWRMGPEVTLSRFDCKTPRFARRLWRRPKSREKTFFHWFCSRLVIQETICV